VVRAGPDGLGQKEKSEPSGFRVARDTVIILRPPIWPEPLSTRPARCSLKRIGNIQRGCG